MITVYYDGELALTYDTANDPTNVTFSGIAEPVPAYSAGSVGLMNTASSSSDTERRMQYDNFAIYPIEMSAGRQYDVYSFDVESIDDLTMWDRTASTTGEWKIASKKLTYTDTSDAKGIATLKAKTKVEDAVVVLEGSAKEGGSFAVLGRYSAATQSYYKLEVDMEKGLTLYKSVGGTETEMATLSLVEAYKKGILMQPGQTYTLKLQMVDNLVAGYIDDYCAFPCTDSDPLPVGVGGIEATDGSAITYLEMAELKDVVKSLTVVRSLDYGVKIKNPATATYSEWTEAVQVPVGGTPDIRTLYLKVLYLDNSVGYVPLDTAEISDFDVATAGNRQVTVAYGQGQTTLAYTVIDRSTAIANLNAYLSAVDATALTLADKATVDQNIRLYNDLTPAEKESISDQNRAKLAAVRTAMEDLVAPEVAGSEVVFVDEYDTPMSEEMYENHNSKTGTRNSGYWHVENGKFLQYSADDQFRSQSYYPSTIVDKGYWNVVRRVSN